MKWEDNGKTYQLIIGLIISTAISIYFYKRGDIVDMWIIGICPPCCYFFGKLYLAVKEHNQWIKRGRPNIR